MASASVFSYVVRVKVKVVRMRAQVQCNDAMYVSISFYILILALKRTEMCFIVIHIRSLDD